MEAMSFCHEHHIAHRDVKLDNILVDMTQPGYPTKLIDFGFSSQNTNFNSKSSAFCGTPAYMSPQLCQKQEYIVSGVDVWASGVLLYTMLFGYQPFRANNQQDLFRKIVKGQYPMPKATVQDSQGST